jgi:SAM-dependent methyltransferase
MKIKKFLKKIYRYIIAHVPEKKFICPICGYNGPFKTYNYGSCLIEHFNCQQCFSASRHRLQYLTVKQLAEHYDFSNKTLLHFAPEPCMKNLLKQMSGAYYSSDISAKAVDCLADLCHLPFNTQSCDIIFASHVMEHIINDRAALKEMYRILKPGGMAILPVPILGPITVEYPKRNMCEYEHVRAPGLDYFKRYEEIFSDVKIFNSNDFPERYQTFLYEDRERWPDTMPLRPTSKGKKHVDFVPVCFK